MGCLGIYFEIYLGTNLRIDVGIYLGIYIEIDLPGHLPKDLVLSLLGVGCSFLCAKCSLLGVRGSVRC